MSQRTYVAIDLKSFYASVECKERGVDPLTTNLVVADASRTEKTICLAVSPSLKEYGIPGRPRLFEVIQRIKEVNTRRIRKAPGYVFHGKSYDAVELKNNPSLEIDFIAAPPQAVRPRTPSAASAHRLLPRDHLPRKSTPHRRRSTPQQTIFHLFRTAFSFPPSFRFCQLTIPTSSSAVTAKG